MNSRLLVSVLIEDGDKILLGRKTPGRGPYPDSWLIIGGGVNLESETLEQAARREVKEETNLEVGELEQVEFNEDNEPDKHGEMTRFVALVFRAKYLGGDPVPGDDLAELRWFDRAELKDLSMPRPSIALFKKLGWI